MELSKLSKVSGIAYLVIGVSMLVCWQVVEPVSDMFNNLFWAATFSFIGIGVINTFVKDGIVTSTHISRILLGALFVVSGLIKANDTLGFSFKLEEYFAEGALGWTFFEPASVSLSVFIAASEIVLGLAVLFGGLIRISSWALMGMILFFAWLTYYTASCNDAQLLGLEHGDCVTDCGCFGDALKGSIGRSLTPWESFFKDITLLAFSLIVFIMQKRIKFNTTKEDSLILPAAIIFNVIVGGWLFGWWLPVIFTAIIIGLYLLVKQKIATDKQMLFTAAISIVFSFGFALYTFTYLPVKDYRGYALGNNLIEMKSNGIAQENNNMFTYKHNETGELLIISQADYMKQWEEVEASYTFESSEEVVIIAGKSASIQDFGPYQQYQFLTEEQKQIDSIANQISLRYAEFYEKVHVLESVYGYTDSVLEIDYDASFYPDSLYKYVGLVEKKISKQNFELDFTTHLFSLDKVLIITSYNIEKTNEAAWANVKKLIDEAVESNIPVYCIAAIDFETAEEFKKKHEINAPFLMADGTELKIVVRSNPGLIYLENAVVKGKWGYNRVPKIGELTE